jgi:hypothetical protein
MLKPYAAPLSIQRREVTTKDGLTIKTEDYTSNQLTTLIDYYRSIDDPVWKELRDAGEDEECKEEELESSDPEYQLSKFKLPLMDLEAHLTSIAECVESLLAIAPPQEYLYISLGSSPTLFTELAKLMSSQVVVVEIPISDIDAGSYEAVRRDEIQLQTILKHRRQSPGFASAAPV